MQHMQHSAPQQQHMQHMQYSAPQQQHMQHMQHMHLNNNICNICTSTTTHVIGPATHLEWVLALIFCRVGQNCIYVCHIWLYIWWYPCQKSLCICVYTYIYIHYIYIYIYIYDSGQPYPFANACGVALSFYGSGYNMRTRTPIWVSKSAKQNARATHVWLVHLGHDMEVCDHVTILWVSETIVQFSHKPKWTSIRKPSFWVEKWVGWHGNSWPRSHPVSEWNGCTHIFGAGLPVINMKP